MNYLEALGIVQWQLHEYSEFCLEKSQGAGLTLNERVILLEERVKAKEAIQHLGGLELFTSFLGRNNEKEKEER